MSEPFDANSGLAAFLGSAPLFPLPNAVFYPQTLFPLHIFEHRYRKMTADALDGNRLIAMALFKPGWEMLKPHELPPIHEMVCLSKITAEEKLPDGRYYLVLQGLSRARVTGETLVDLPYRIGQLDLCTDCETGLSACENQSLREELLKSVQSLHPNLATNPLFIHALNEELSLGVLCDLLAQALRFEPSCAQRLLEETRSKHRCQLLLQAMRARCQAGEASPGHFPPKFSRN